MSDRVFVKILSHGIIPFVQQAGPVLIPVTVSRQEFNSLKAMGYEIVETSAALVETIPTREVAPATEAPATEDPASETPAPDATVAEVPVETVEEAPVEEESILVDDPEFSGGAYYTRAFVSQMIKSQCRTVLDGRGVEHAEDATAKILKDSVIATNPAVEGVEE